MKQRDQVTMTAEEAADLLAAGRKLQLATINPDGTPHLVTMYYALIGGQIAFWTYRSSQKARNLARDPRVTCLVETGEQYFDLRGVQVQGTVRWVDDPAGVLAIGRRVAAAMTGAPAAGTAASPGGTAAPAAGTGEPSALAGEPAAMAGLPADGLDEYLARAARKRVGFIVQPRRIISWDHGKLT